MKLENIVNQISFEKYQEYLESTQLSSATIQRKISSLQSFQRYLFKKKLISSPPSNYITKKLQAIPSPQIPPHKPNFQSKFFNHRFTPYIIISLFLILFSGLGYAIYQQTFLNATKNLAYTTASSPVRAGRFLSFQGRLTDSSGNPIVSSTDITFKLYNASSAGTELYTTGVGATVTPDDNGIFSVQIGQTHGTEIPNSVFTENSEVWLEITAGGETMDPRQQIATVAYALNSETLQGLPPSASGLKDTVLVIDSSGNLNLGETSPSIVSTSGTFGIEGQAMLLKASDGSGGNITINPDASGIIKLVTEGTGSTAVGGFIEATNANLATGNLYSALIRNDNRGYNFIDFQNYDTGTTQLSSRFSVDASGNTIIGNNLTLSGALITNSTSGLAGQVLTSTGVGTSWTSVSGLSVGNADTTDNYHISGTANYLSKFNSSNDTLTTSLLYDNGTNVGIGTTNPSRKLEISGAASGLAFSGSGVHYLGASEGTLEFGAFATYSDSNYYGLTANSTNQLRDSKNPNLIAQYWNGSSTQQFSAFMKHYMESTAPTSRLGFSINNNELLSIKSSGNIGIGTTNPTSLLTLSSGTTSPSSGILFGSDTNLYRSASNTLRTDDSLIVGSRTATTNTGDIFTSGGLSIGSVSTAPLSNSVLDIVDQRTVSTSSFRGLRALVNTNPSADGLNLTGLEMVARDFGSHTYNLGVITGIKSSAQMTTANTASLAYAVNATIANSNVGGTIGTATGLYLETSNAGHINTYYGVKSISPSGGGTISNSYSLYLENLGGTNNNFGIYQSSDLSKNYFAGNVGIGTTNPSTSLYIKGGSNAGIGIEGAFSTRTAELAWDNALFITGTTGAYDYQLQAGAGSNIRFNTNSSEKMILTSSGYLGIGTTNPTSPLSIGTTNSSGLSLYATGDITADRFVDKEDSNYFIDPANTSISPSISLSNYGSIAFNAQYSSGWKSFSNSVAARISNSSTGLAFQTSSAVGTTAPITWSENLFLKNDGNVGIGTTNPSYKLDISGDINLTGAFRSNGNPGLAGQVLTSTGVGTSWTNISGLSVGNADTTDNYHISGTANYLTKFNSSNDTLTTSLIYDNGTNVSIGTTSPLSKFQIGNGQVSQQWSGTTAPYVYIQGVDNEVETSSLLIQDENLNTMLNITTTGDSTAGKAYFGGSVEMEGNLGVGTTNPSEKIHVLSGSSAYLLLNSGANQDSGFRFKEGTDPSGFNFFYQGSSSNQFRIDAYGPSGFINTRLAINRDNGYVGIGTTSPTQKLDVSGKIALDGTVIAYRPTNMTGTLIIGNGGNNLLNTTGNEGYFNTFVGLEAGVANTKGAYNVASGAYALYSNTEGYSNAATGYAALFGNITGIHNVSVGLEAGRFIANGATANTTGDYNLFLGSRTKALADNDQNSVVIGYNTTGAGSNSVVLGSDAITKTILKGNVGIGTTSPLAKLHVYNGDPSSPYKDIYATQINDALESRLQLRSGDSGSYGSGLILTTGTSSWSAMSQASNDSNKFHIGYRNIPSADEDILLQSSKLFTITTTGNVGINNSNPFYKLDVSGDGRFTTNLSVGGTLSLSQGASSGYILTSDASGNSYWAPNTGIGTTYAAGNGLTLASNTFKLGGALTENTNLTIGSTSAFFINSTTGNVGIGTTNPSEALHIYKAGTNSIGTKIENGAGSLRMGQIYDGNAFIYESAAKSLFLGTNNGTKLTIDAIGNVGIGTTSPTQKLDVSGKIALDGTVVTYRPTNMSGTLIFGNGGNSLSHTTGNEGYYNTFVGLGSGYTNSTGDANTASGFNSLYFNSTGHSNTATGRSALYNTTGSANSAYGRNALYFNTTGYSNTAQGYDSGSYISDGTTANTTGSYNLFLGANTKALSNGDQNEIVIGYNAIGAGSNSVVLGGDSIIKTILKGNIGIGTTSPSSKLEVLGSGSLFRLADSSNNTLVSITDSNATFNLPTAFNSSGDVSLAYNLNFTNPTASYINSQAPLYLTAGEIFNSSDLTLKTYNSGSVVIDSQTLAIGGTLSYPQGAQAGYILQTDASGNASWVLPSASGIGTTYAAGNGLTLASNTFKLGGALTENTNLTIGSSSAFYINSTTGNVGIGTTNPASLLTLGNTNSIISTDTTDGSDNKRLQLAGGGTSSVTRGAYINVMGNEFSGQEGDLSLLAGYSGVSGKGALRFFTGNVSERMTITSGGNVGIGTTAPGAKLDIVHSEDITAFSELRIAQRIQLYDNAGGLWTKGGAGLAFAYKASDIDTDVSAIYGVTQGTTGGQLLFHTLTSGSLTEKMRITSDGNVGIGTTNPNYSLEISKIGNSSIYLDADTDNVDETENAFIKLSQDAGSVQSIFGTVGNAGYNPENVFYAGTIGNATLLGTLDSNGGLQFGTNDAVRMTITPSGNIGIGTTNPGAKLEVSGSIYLSNLAGSIINHTTESSYDKIRVWNSSLYTIGMASSQSLGFLGDYAMTFTMNNDTNRGWLWRDTDDIASDGAMSLTTDGRLYLKSTAALMGNVGIGTSNPGEKLSVVGNISISHDSYLISGANKIVLDDDLSALGATNSLSITAMNKVIIGSNNNNNGTGDIFFGHGSSNPGDSAWENLMVIKNSGNVGIGTTAPNYKLDVSGDINLTGALRSSGSAGTSGQVLSSTGTGTQWIDISASGVGGSGTLNYIPKWSPNGTTLGNSLLFDTGTNVGIGTTSPQSKLHLDGDFTTKWSVTFQHYQSTWGVNATRPYLNKGFISGIYGDYLYLGSTGNNTNTGQSAMILSQTGTFFGRGSDDGTSLSTNWLMINSSGNVGIGTTSPSSPLSLYANNSTTVAPGALIEQAGTGDASLTYLLSGVAYWSTGIDNSDGDKFKISRASNLNNNVALAIDSAGNVGLGTASPSYRLDVSGDINLTGALRSSGSAGTSGQVLSSTGTGTQWIDLSASGVGGSGTTNYIAKWSPDGNTLSDSLLFDTGTNVGIGTTNPTQQLELTANLKLANTTSSSTGVIYKGTTPFIHNFQHPTGNTEAPEGYNTFVGVNSGNFTMGSTSTFSSQASRNTGLGYNTLNSNTTGYRNSAIGFESLYSNTSGNLNSAIGVESLYSNISGNFNTAIGGASLRSNTTGNSNSAIGFESLHSNTTGYVNSSLGYSSLRSNTTGYYNSAIGADSLYNNTTGYYNSAIGVASLYNNTTGYYNVAIGNNSGAYIADGLTENTTGDYNIFLGHKTKALADNDQNEIVIGYDAIGVGSNSVVLGNDSITKTVLRGNVGIGTTNPINLLDVNGNAKFGELSIISDWPAILFNGYNDGSNRYTSTDYAFKIENDQSANKLNFVTYQSGTAGNTFSGATTALTIDASTSNVGIGTTNPTQQLELTGNLKLAMTTSTSTGIIYKGSEPFIHNFQHPTGGTAIPAGNNTFIGIQSGNFTMGSTASISAHGSYNTAIGYRTLTSNTTGQFNTAIGTYSLYLNNSGFYNTAQGYNSLYNNTTGNSNTSIGMDSLQANTTGSSNAVLGYNALRSNTTGNNNSAFGREAGRFLADGSTANSSPDYSLYLGYNTKSGAADANAQNEIVIGYDTTGAGSNSVVLGNDSITKTVLKGNIGIGTTNPIAPLDIGTTNSSGISMSVTGDIVADRFVDKDNQTDYFLDPANTSNNPSLSLSGLGSMAFNARYDSGSMQYKTFLNTSSAYIANSSSGLSLFTSSAVGVTAPTTWDQNLFLETGGNVGIGTTNPNEKLEVNGSIRIPYSGQFQFDDGSIAFIDENWGLQLNGLSTHPIQVLGGSLSVGYDKTASGDWGSNNLFVAGNVGIGTTYSTAKLTVVGSAGDSRSVSLDSRELKFRGDGVAHMSILGPDTGKSYLTFQDTSSNYQTGTAGTDLMTIMRSGDVGIGTVSPSTKLEVDFDSPNSTLTGTSAYGGIHLNQSATNDDFVGITTTATSAGTQGGILFQGSGGYGTKIHFLTTSSYAAGMQNRMTLDQYGKLGIGTDSPSYDLHLYKNLNTGSQLAIQNANNGTSAYSILRLINNTGSGAHLFLNSSTRTADGGTNTATLRNDAGELKLQSSGSRGISIEPTTGTIGLGATNYNYYPSGGDWNYNLILNSQDTTSIGFHDSAHSVSSIKYLARLFTIGGDDGWGVANVTMPGRLGINTTSYYSTYMLSAVDSIDSVEAGVAYFEATNNGGSTYGRTVKVVNSDNSSFNNALEAYYNGTGAATSAIFAQNTYGTYGVRSSNNNAGGYALYTTQSNGSGYSVYALGGRNYFQGSVGIGMTPTYKLDVSGDIRANNGDVFASGGMRPKNQTGLGPTAWVDTPYGFSTIGQITEAGMPSYTTGFRIRNTNPTTAGLEISGYFGSNSVFYGRTHWDTGDSWNAWKTFTTSNWSDINLKTNLAPIDDALEKIDALTGYYYDWKVEEYPGFGFDHQKQIGLIAQDVEKLFPSLVTTDPNGVKNLEYRNLVALNLQGIKQLNTRLKSLETDLSISQNGQVQVNYNISPDVLKSLGYSDSKNEIEAATYSVTDELGNLVTRVGSFSELAAAKVKAGLISSKNIITDNLLAETTKTKDLKVSTISPLSDLSDTITINGDASVSGTLTATTIESQDIKTSTLYADQIISREGNFSTIMTDKIASLRNEIRSIIDSNTASSSAITGSTLLAQAESWTEYLSLSSTSSAQINGSLALTDSMVIGAQLNVLGQTQLGDTFVTGTFSTGQIAIQDNFIETTNTALFIQPSGLGSVHIMGDTLVVADNGDVQINGSLNINGNLTAQSASVSGSLIANLLTAQQAQIDTLDTKKINVATDSATLIIADSGFAALATSSAKLNSNASAGSATLPAGKTEIVIFNNQIKQNSMVYLTPVGSTQNQVPYLKSKFVSPTPSPTTTTPDENSSYFTIALDQPLTSDIDINWWIIN